MTPVDLYYVQLIRNQFLEVRNWIHQTVKVVGGSGEKESLWVGKTET